MPVPTSGNFNMFGVSNTTIQGAIVEGGGSAGALTTFNGLINVSNVNLFDPQYSGGILGLTDVSESTQYRGYPKLFTAVSIGTNLGSGFASSSAACTSTGSISTIYISEGNGQSLYQAFINGKRLWSNTSLTTPFNGNNLWYKTTGTANNGDSFQVGTDGFIQQWGTGCATTSNPGVSCNVQSAYTGGQEYPTEIVVSLGSSTGTVNLTINPIAIPDRFIVIWNSNRVIDTGYRSNRASNYVSPGGISRSEFTSELVGKVDPVLGTTYPDTINFLDGYPNVLSITSFSFLKNLATPTFAIVRVYGPLTGTEWSFTLSCPS
jgi:hypothetical protein